MNAGATGDRRAVPEHEPRVLRRLRRNHGAGTRRASAARPTARALTPSVDIAFDDVWTDAAAAGRAPDASFAYRYVDLTTPAPTSAGLHDAAGAPAAASRSTTSGTSIRSGPSRASRSPPTASRCCSDDTCTGCHSPNAAAALPRCRPRQLELTDGPSADVRDAVPGLRELLATDNEQELVGGVLQDRLVQIGVDPVTGRRSSSGAGRRVDDRRQRRRLCDVLLQNSPRAAATQAG